jgi:multiple sugar transport system substrate-binding protein
MVQKSLSRRQFLKLAAMTAAGGVLASCTPAAAPTTAPAATAAQTAAPAAGAGGPISVLLASDKQWIPDLIKKFTADTGINVNPVIVDWNDLGTKFTVAAAAGAATYDVAEVDPSAHGAFMKAGWLEPLDTYLAPIKDNLVNPNIFAYDGKIYGMPWFIDAYFFYYNQEMLEKAGLSAPPTTWDELRSQAQTVQQKGLADFPLAFQWKQIEGEFDVYLAFLLNNGGKLLDETLTKPLFNSPEGVAALQFLADLNLKDKLVNPGSFSMRPLEVMTEMSQGRSAFAILWGEVAGSLNDASQSQVIGKIKSSLIPVAKAGNASYTVDGSEALGIPSTSKNKDAAWKFIQYFTSEAEEKNIVANLGALPVYKSLFSDPVMSSNPWSKENLEQLKNAFVRPGMGWYPELSETMQVATISALNGSQTPQQALTDAEQKVVEILKKG